MNNWVQDSIFYHIYPFGFCDAPRFYEEEIHHRLHKIEDFIEHLVDMHVNALYLGPVNASYEHGYDTSDYQRIDPRLGTNEDFKHLCDALHKAGIRIILDGVFNHVGRDFWAFQDVQKKLHNSPYANWFHNINFNQTSPMQDPFSYDAWEGHYNLVKLNLQNEEVVQHLLSSIGMWMDNYHIDGLRLDAADCIDPNFFKRLKQFTKEKDSSFWLMGEIIHGDYTRWANDEMLDSVTNYECYKGLFSSHNTKNYFEIAYSLNRQFGSGGIYKNLCLYNFVDNHDVNRLASLVENQIHLSNIYTLLYTMPGIPSIYYGSEYGITGTKHDGSDADVRPSIAHILQSTKNEKLYKHLCKLGSMRCTHKELAYGNYQEVVIRNEQFVYKREYQEHVYYIALNLSDQDANMRISDQDDVYEDILQEEIITKDPSGCICIPAYSARVLQPTTISKAPKKKKQEQKKEITTTPLSKEPMVSIPTVTASSLKIGKYRHFKGKSYAVLYIAKHSEDLEEYVVYRQLYGEGSVWIRPLSMFQEIVEVDGQQIPRFTYIGK